jgi:hypothetical protein
MPGRRVSHSEARWALLPPTIIRCNAMRPNGSRCKREAEPELWSATSTAALRPKSGGAAERLIMTADQAAQMLVTMMEDTEVPFGVRAKIAQDLLDRAGLIATQVYQMIPTTEDPVMRFFGGIFSDPNNWESSMQSDPTPAIESYATSSLDHHDPEPAEILETEIVGDAESGNDTPPRVAEMIKAGAFDRKAGSDRRPLPPVERATAMLSPGGAAVYQNSTDGLATRQINGCRCPCRKDQVVLKLGQGTTMTAAASGDTET